MEPRSIRGGNLGGHNPPGRPLQMRPCGLSLPGGPADFNPDTIKSHSSLKAKYSFFIHVSDTSPTYLLYLTLFLLFWTLICMIWMKLTPDWRCFSRTTMVLFLCRNKSSRNGTKLCEDFLYQWREFLEPRSTGGGTQVGTTHQGADTSPTYL